MRRRRASRLATEPDAAALEERLLRFVRDDLAGGRPLAIDADTYLFADGLIDSLKILQLIAFLELEIGRDIPDSDVVMKNFRTVHTMASRFGGPR
jgi:acyl carrier protein